MLKAIKNGTQVVSESGKDLGRFTVTRSGKNFVVHNKDGKVYKKFTTREKALRYTKYLAHKQLATVEYFKKARTDGMENIYAEFDSLWGEACKPNANDYHITPTTHSYYCLSGMSLKMNRPTDYKTQNWLLQADTILAFKDAFIEVPTLFTEGV